MGVSSRARRRFCQPSSRELVGSSGKVGGSGGWGHEWRLGKWQFVESWQDCQLLKLCLLEGKETGTEAVGGFQWEREDERLHMEQK